MLQQTRVETVVPRYEAFLERFPTVDALAAARTADVLAVWSGLGYYARARRLLAAARILADRKSFPDSLEGWKELPGVGEYTAAAVSSIALGIAVPVLDGNVERVLARRLALSGDPKGRGARDRLLAAARELMVEDRPGDSNQALMELGATVCRPRNPRCPECPLAPGCAAHAAGDPESYPAPRRRRRRERQRWTALVARRPDSSVFLIRHPPDAPYLSGLWSVPWIRGLHPKRRAESRLEASWGVRCRLGGRLGEFRHAITFRDLTVRVHRGEVFGRAPVRDGGAGPECGWFTPDRLDHLGSSAVLSKALRLAS